MINEEWEKRVTGSRMFRVHHKLKWCKLHCIKWRKQKNDNANKELKQLQAEMKALQKMEGTRDWTKWQQLKNQSMQLIRMKRNFEAIN